MLLIRRFPVDSALGSSSLRGAFLIVLVFLVQSNQAMAGRLNFNQFDDAQDDFAGCGMTIVGSDELNTFTLGGLTVTGGDSDLYFDGGETLEVTFDVPAVGVRYALTNGIDLDGDGVIASTILEAFDAGGSSLGLRFVSGIQSFDVSGLYGNVAMSRLVLMPIGDGMIIRSIEHDPVGPIEVDFSRLGTSNDLTNWLNFCIVDFGTIGNGMVRTFRTNDTVGGMGVAGGLSDYLVDGTEQLFFDLPYPVESLVIESLLLDLDADQNFGEAFLFAYGEDSNSLGGVSLGTQSSAGGPIEETLDVSALFPGEAILGINIRSNGDARRLDRVIYSPEPTGAGLFGLAWLAAMGSKRLRRRRANPSNESVLGQPASVFITRSTA